MVSRHIICRVILGVTPFRVLRTLLITYLLSPPRSFSDVCKLDVLTLAQEQTVFGAVARSF